MLVRDMVSEIIEAYPPLNDGLDISLGRYISEPFHGDRLVAYILNLYELNDLDFSVSHVSGKGWTIEMTFPSGIDGVEAELSPSFDDSLPKALLSSLYSYVVMGKQRPVTMDRKVAMRRKGLR